MKQRLAGVLLIAGFFLIQLVLVSTSHAIPAFSRANKVECTTCHTIAPELNEYGDAFLKNSYVYVGKAISVDKKATAAKVKSVAKKKPVDTAADAGVAKVMGGGDPDKLNKLKAGAMSVEGVEQVVAAPVPDDAASADGSAEGKSEWQTLAGIPDVLPISFTGAINYGFGDDLNISDGNKYDYSARSFKLHAGGNFRDKIGFFTTYVAYSEQPAGGTYNTSDVPENNKTNINEMFLQLRNFLDTPVNLKIGRMQPKLGLWKTNNKVSVTNNYLPYNYRVGAQSAFNVEQFQDVLELNAVVAKRLFVAGGMVNRKGQDAKEGYGHVSYKIGGSDYLGNESDIDLAKDENILDFLALTVGAYGYSGENGSNVMNTPRNSYTRAGIDTELQYKIFRLRLLGGWGSDDNVDLAAPAGETKVISRAATVEGEFTLRVNLIAAARYERLHQKGNSPAVFTGLDMSRYVGTIAYAPLENVKLSTEFKYETVEPNTINRIGTVGATFSF